MVVPVSKPNLLQHELLSLELEPALRFVEPDSHFVPCRVHCRVCRQPAQVVGDLYLHCEFEPITLALKEKVLRICGPIRQRRIQVFGHHVFQKRDNVQKRRLSRRVRANQDVKRPKRSGEVAQTSIVQSLNPRDHLLSPVRGICSSREAYSIRQPSPATPLPPRARPACR